MENDGTFNIRVSADLKKRFIRAAQKKDQTAAQVIRFFMREYVRKVEANDGK